MTDDSTRQQAEPPLARPLEDWMTLGVVRATAQSGLAAVVLALGLAASGGCGGTGGGNQDGGRSDGARTCTASQVFCRGSEAVTCDATGHEGQVTRCTGATPSCVAGMGCVACPPNTTRCDPTNPERTQSCPADHSGWVDGADCGGSDGRRCVAGQCLNACEEAAANKSYLGCEYWPVTIRNTCLSEAQPGANFPFAITVSNPQDQAAQVTIDGGALGSPLARTVPAHGLVTVELPWVAELAQLWTTGYTNRALGGVVRRGGAYHVTSDRPVTVSQFNPLTYRDRDFFSYSNDASLLLPTSILGRAYTLLTWPGQQIPNGAGTPWPAGGTITIVGTGSSTTHIDVTLTGATIAGTGVTAGTAGATQGYDLGRGDVVQLVGGGMGSDLSGSTVRANGPVAVFAGHACAFIPTTARVAGDHLEEQLFPDTAWGTRYVVSAFGDRPSVPSVVRIIALQSDTTLRYDPAPVTSPPTRLSARQTVQFETTDSFSVSADKPILVAQFMYGGGNTSSDTTEADPAMVYEVPVEQFRTEYTFLVPATYEHNYINVVGQTGVPPQLDGVSVTVPARPIGQSNFNVWTVPITTPGVHRLGSSGNAQGYGLKVYGTAVFTSYAYPGGLDLRPINPG